MFAAVDPIKVGLIFLGAAATSCFFGTKILCLGWRGFFDAEYPLSASRNLTGLAARLVATLILLFGIAVIACGIATSVFGYYRLRQLL